MSELHPVDLWANVFSVATCWSIVVLILLEGGIEEVKIAVAGSAVLATAVTFYAALT